MGDKQNLAKESQLALKQDKLIAGSNITIALDGKTISAANPTSVTVTPIYQAGTLVAAIVVNGNTTNIYAPAQHGDNSNQNLAASFSTSATYEEGDYVIYQENLYKCTTAITVAGAWDASKWMRVLITEEMGQGSGGDYANQNLADTYDSTSTYAVGDYVIYDGLLYKCITAVTTPGLWNASYWEHVLITDEMGSGGGLDLPDNWTWDEEALTAFGFVPKNSLGWGVGNTTYYTDTQMTWEVGGRRFTRDNAIPALIAYVVHDGWNGTICVSTSAEATHFSWNDQEYGPYEYMGYSWYLSGMNYSMTYNWHSDNINYLGSYSGSQGEKMVHDIIDASNLNGMTDQFISIMQPGSGTLIAGGGEETDLSDATFKVETDGTVHGADFVQGDKSWDEWKMDYQEITQAEYDELTPEEKEDITFFITDGVAPPGSDIVPNPQGEATDTLEKLEIDGTIYDFEAGSNVEPNPQGSATDTLEKLEIDGTIYELAGGTGDVADVNVNGISVLDANKIAQIVSYKEVTQAQYDALPASKESDNVLYCIKDKATADTTVAPIIYSEEEREVGVWTNGKPLYQKVWIFDPYISIGTRSSTTSNINSTDIDDVIYVYSLHEDGTGYCDMMADPTMTNHTELGLRASEAHNITRLILQYTKTTDAPGSGKYAPSGVPAVHYSENEHVVGTWINGSTLYERTLYQDLSGQAEHWYVYLDTLIDDINDYTIINFQGQLQFKEGSYIYSHIVPNYIGGSSYYYINRNNGRWYLYFHSGNATCDWGYVTATIRYVKEILGQPSS